MFPDAGRVAWRRASFSRAAGPGALRSRARAFFRSVVSRLGRANHRRRRLLKALEADLARKAWKRRPTYAGSRRGAVADDVAGVGRGGGPTGRSLKDLLPRVRRAPRRLARDYRRPQRRGGRSRSRSTSFVERAADAFRLDGSARWAYRRGGAARGRRRRARRVRRHQPLRVPARLSHAVVEGFWEDLRHPDCLFPEEGGRRHPARRAGAVHSGGSDDVAATRGTAAFSSERRCSAASGLRARVLRRCTAAGAYVILERMEQGWATRSTPTASGRSRARDCCNTTGPADGAVGRYASSRTRSAASRPCSRRA